jgi:hypothetical protein
LRFVLAEFDTVLAAEQEYLTLAREYLAHMRERVLSLEIHGIDALNSQLLARSLSRRVRELTDDPRAPLFFGRIDQLGGDRWYIGRRHVADHDGDPVVIDWRAEVALAFYRASTRDPLGLRRRRRFGLDSGRITGYEDEYLTDTDGTAFHSEILAREIERPRVGPMRDIVSTIQPGQDEIVRFSPDRSICVQGAPGTGKTAVGLHRAAWLLYTDRERLGRRGVLFVGPNASFLDHVSAVLPSLGEADVRHTTVDRLTRAPAAGHAAEPVEVAQLKGDPRLAEVLRRAVWSHVRTPTEPLVVTRGTRRWRLPAHDVAAMVTELVGRDIRYLTARDLLPQRLAHALRTLMEETGAWTDDRAQGRLARSKEVRRYTEEVWPDLQAPVVLFRLLGDPERRAEWADGLLTAAEQDLLGWPRSPRSPRAARWTLPDAVLLDELDDLLRRTPSLGHVVLDEAQDLSPMQLRAVGRRCATGTVTVLGDIAQGTTPWATHSWQESLTHLGHPGAFVLELAQGFRVPETVISYAARLLPEIAPGLVVPSSVRDHPGSLRLVPVPGPVWAATIEGVRRALGQEGSVGVIVADAAVAEASGYLEAATIHHEVLGQEPAHEPTDDADDDPAEPTDDELVRVAVVPSSVAKGLEFDHVVVVEPADIADAEPDRRSGLRRLYVVLTRAVTSLTVLHHRPVPDPLGVPAAAAAGT